MAQQSSPSRVGGMGYRVFEHGGQKYVLSQPLRLLCYKEEEAFVLSRRRDPALFGLRMYKQLPQSSQVALWEGCARADMGGIPSPDEWLAYNASLWKSAYVFWHCLDPRHKVDEGTKEPIDLLAGMDWAVEFLHGLTREEFERLMVLTKIISQDEAVKNSSGRTATARPANEQQPEDLDMTDGPPSTSISENDTNTDPRM